MSFYSISTFKRKMPHIPCLFFHCKTKTKSALVFCFFNTRLWTYTDRSQSVMSNWGVWDCFRCLKLPLPFQLLEPSPWTRTEAWSVRWIDDCNTTRGHKAMLEATRCTRIRRRGRKLDVKRNYSQSQLNRTCFGAGDLQLFGEIHNHTAGLQWPEVVVLLIVGASCLYRNLSTPVAMLTHFNHLWREFSRLKFVETFLPESFSSQSSELPRTIPRRSGTSSNLPS